MLTDRLRTIGSLSLLAMIVATCGCKSIDAPAAQVIPQAQAGAGTLQSATVVYSTRLASSPKLTYRTSSPESNLPSAQRTLAIRYPYSESRADVALAEVVIVDGDSQRSRASTGPTAKIAGALRDCLPGVALGEGVHQAKALEVPVSETSGDIESGARPGAAGPS